MLLERREKDGDKWNSGLNPMFSPLAPMYSDTKLFIADPD